MCVALCKQRINQRENNLHLEDGVQKALAEKLQA